MGSLKLFGQCPYGNNTFQKGASLNEDSDLVGYDGVVLRLQVEGSLNILLFLHCIGGWPWLSGRTKIVYQTPWRHSGSLSISECLVVQYYFKITS